MPRSPKPDPDHVPNQDTLAERLGVTRKTVGNWLRQGAPRALADGRYNVPAWEDWVANRSDDGAEGEDGPDESKALKIAKTREEVRKLKLANDEKERVLVPGEEWEMALSQMLVMFNTTLDTLPERLASMLTGRMDHADKVAIIFKEVEALKEVLRGTNKYLAKPA